MKVFIFLILLFLTFYNVYLGSALVRHGEVNFFNDVARDFLLLQELDEKKIVFIGPRSSTNGLFNGPLWSYINYPAFILGNGNPVIVAWFWVGLTVMFLITSFFMIKKLFGILPAAVFILLSSVKMAPHMNNVFHSEATFFFVPFLFFTICMYIKSKKNLFLVLHLLALAILIQLNVGMGIQFLMLSTLLVFWFVFKNKLWKHLLTFSLLPVFLLNLVLFDLRHGLLMAKALVATGKALQFFTPFGSWLENRINNMVSLQLFEANENNFFILAVFVIIITFTILQIKKRDKYQHIYSLFLFYYFGYMFTSFFNKGILLFHYVYLLIPLTTLWLVSFLGTRYKIFFIPIILIIYTLNLQSAQSYINSRQKSFIGNDYNSWKSLELVAERIITWQKGEDFGYFVFAPDALAYQPRYAMTYHFKKAHAKAFEYVKKQTTYIIAAPPPANNPYMTHVWWRKVQVRISSEPAETKKFPSGFTIEKFNLSPEEQRVGHVKAIELGIHFR